MSVKRAGRAHNDYLEVAIEAGLPGIILIGAWLALIPVVKETLGLSKLELSVALLGMPIAVLRRFIIFIFNALFFSALIGQLR